MTEHEPIETKNLDLSGNAPLPWSRPREHFAANIFLPATLLGTTRPDGRPHAAFIGAVWLDGKIYFTSSLETRKARNLAVNPACTIAMRLASLDLVLEGEAVRVTDHETLERVAAHIRAGGWPVQIMDDALTAPYAAPSAGPPPWHLYCFSYHTAIGNAIAEPHGATRWRFAR
ncbi:MAG: pyridoxamine 5'-phosphate oxidase family protein [Oscillochloridaceae bacterium umkhey_bin13]